MSRATRHGDAVASLQAKTGGGTAVTHYQLKQISAADESSGSGSFNIVIGADDAANNNRTGVMADNNPESGEIAELR